MKIVTLLGKRSFICRSSPGRSIIFPCPDLFVGLSVLCSYWMLETIRGIRECRGVRGVLGDGRECRYSGARRV